MNRIISMHKKRIHTSDLPDQCCCFSSGSQYKTIAHTSDLPSSTNVHKAAQLVVVVYCLVGRNIIRCTSVIYQSALQILKKQRITVVVVVVVVVS
jgi:hypothetical protein